MGSLHIPGAQHHRQITKSNFNLFKLKMQRALEALKELVILDLRELFSPGSGIDAFASA